MRRVDRKGLSTVLSGHGQRLRGAVRQKLAERQAHVIVFEAGEVNCRSHGKIFVLKRGLCQPLRYLLGNELAIRHCICLTLGSPGQCWQTELRVEARAVSVLVVH
jgi:hypothetical protein